MNYRNSLDEDKLRKFNDKDRFNSNFERNQAVTDNLHRSINDRDIKKL